MKLTDLEPQFIKSHSDHHTRVDKIAEADGIMFLCPVCFLKNGNSPVGTHVIICWQPHVPQTIFPKPGRWKFIGTSFSDLSLRAGSSSISLTGGCNAHFYIRNGIIEIA